MQARAFCAPPAICLRQQSLTTKFATIRTRDRAFRSRRVDGKVSTGNLATQGQGPSAAEQTEESPTQQITAGLLTANLPPRLPRRKIDNICERAKGQARIEAPIAYSG